ncbi:MAG: exodeoxyribonuclease VII small subunit [Leptonema sp. (in: bacteria)]
MKKFNFEEAFKRLEEITQILEENELPLEEAIQLYEEAMELKNQCYDYLKKAEGKIYKISDPEKKTLEQISVNSFLNNNELFG